MRRLLLCSLLLASTVHADPIDDVVEAEMAKRKIPGLSLAVYENGRIVKVKAYGVIKAGEATPVTPQTLFQAGSVSKSVAAVGVLTLVDKKKLTLDEDVNRMLTSWKVPAFTGEKPVTLRGILSHSAGLTVHGFPGYPAGSPVPSLVQVLDGKPPANTPPIVVDIPPGSRWRYSGGGYTVMQQLVVDVTKLTFPQFMQKTVLGPAGMFDSTFEQPPPPRKAERTAFAHDNRRKPLDVRYHVYPEMAAAGLWTNPTDLARFGMELQKEVAGKSKKILSIKLAKELATTQSKPSGLGVFLEGEGAKLTLSHGGRDEGFDTRWIGFAESGQGAVIMINTNDNSAMNERILDAIERQYHWPNAFSPPTVTRIGVTPEALARATGTYELANNRMIVLTAGADRLYTLSDGLPDEELVPTAPGRFVALSGMLELELIEEKGQVVGFTTKRDGQPVKVPRILPLIGERKPTTDPAPALTAKVLAGLQALGRGKPDPVLAKKMVEDFGGAFPVLEKLTGLRFVLAQDVTGRGLERHEGKVARVVVYEMVPPGPSRYLLVHLMADNLVTDLDTVDE